jgi:hypothetical protein
MAVDPPKARLTGAERMTLIPIRLSVRFRLIPPSLLPARHAARGGGPQKGARTNKDSPCLFDLLYMGVSKLCLLRAY